MPRGAERSLWDCRGVREFIKANGHIAAHNGKRDHEAVPAERMPSRWREKEWREGYTFRFDAVKFCRQLFIPEHAATDMADGEILVWLDGDVETVKAVPEGFVEALVGTADGAFLGRMGTHSEIGFWAVRLNRLTRRMLSDIANMYRDGTVFSLPETHSAFVWDFVRQTLPAINMKNLTPRGKGHVWPTTELAAYTRHDKGNRKYRGAAQ